MKQKHPAEQTIDAICELYITQRVRPDPFVGDDSPARDRPGRTLPAVESTNGSGSMR